MTAVRTKGTIGKDDRPNDGLEAFAEELALKEFDRWTIVAVVELDRTVKLPGEAPVPVIRFVAREIVTGEDEATVRGMLDAARQARGQGPMSGTLFDRGEGDPGEGGDAGTLPGQLALDDPFTPPTAEG